MGSGLCSTDHADPKNSGFVSPRLLHGAKLIALSQSLRKLFVSFILSKEWMPNYLDVDNNDLICLESCYQLPSGRNFDPTNENNCLYKSKSSLSLSQSVATSNSSISCDNSSNKFTSLHSVLINNSSARSSSHLPVLIIAGILPIFLVSPDYRDWMERTLRELESSGRDRQLHQQILILQTHFPKPHQSFLLRQKPALTPLKPLMLGSNLQQEKIVEESEEDLESVQQGRSNISSPMYQTTNKQFSTITGHSSSSTEATSLCSNSSIHLLSSTTNNTYNNSVGVKYSSDKDAAKSLENCILQAVDLWTFESLDKLLGSNEWLREFVCFLEKLPFCITLASATQLDSDGKGFPLLYVNNAFEQTTLYSRGDILGKNCSFLQQAQSVEMQQVDLMRHSLRNQQSVKLALTNIRKDGSAFFNFLAMKPIINSFGEFTHVLGVQYPLEGHEESFMEDCVVINDLFCLLSNVLY